MYWVMQSNLFDEAAFADLLDQLDRQEVEYSIVKMIPFVGEIDPDVVVPKGENVFVLGSTAIGKVARKKGWVPGYFDDNLNMEIFVEKFGPHALNAGAIFSKFRDVTKVWDKFFIRPCSDKKEFAGMVTTWDEFAEWQPKVVELDGESSMTTLTGDDRVMIAPLTEIYAEYRFYVVDGKPITGSQYKLGNRVIYKNVDDGNPAYYDLWWYAHNMVDRWQPCRAYVLDIAGTPDGYKVIEINAINSSGFYHCDMGKFVNAINNMRFGDER